MHSKITRLTEGERGGGDRAHKRFKYAEQTKDFNSAFFQFLESSNLSCSKTKLLNFGRNYPMWSSHTRQLAPLSISSRYFFFCLIEPGTPPERIMQQRHPRTSFDANFFPTPAISSSLCRAVGNVDACGHFARNVSSDARRDIRWQKRGTSPTSIIMCVTCEGEETSFCVQSLSGCVLFHGTYLPTRWIRSHYVAPPKGGWPFSH